MTYLEDYRGLLRQIANRTRAVPEIAEVLLPGQRADPEKKDEFGFVLLSDGSAGAFYTSLDDTLADLRHELHEQGRQPRDTLTTAAGLGSMGLHSSALALGAFNALSQHLMKRAAFDPVAHSRPTLPGDPAVRIGMVGYFPPLAEKFLQQGFSITVIEKQPARVPEVPGLEVFTTPEALAECGYVICTASTLINNTIEQILRAARPQTSVNLFGPSASGLPDPLFARGVASVAGIVIDRVGQLREALASGEPWGSCGRKYQLSPGSYPGVAQLLERIG